MFKKVERASKKWIDTQLELLSDICLLTKNIDRNLSTGLERFSSKLNTLDVESKNAICKDHVFHKWLIELKALLLDAYGKGSKQLLDTERFSFIINMLNLTVSVAADTELRFILRSSFGSRILLPGTGYFIKLPDDVLDRDARECRYVPGQRALEVESSQKALSSFEQVESISVVDRNFAFFADPTGDQYVFEFDDSIDIPKWTKTLQEALNIIRTDDLSHQLVKDFVAFIVPLCQCEEERNQSFSVRNLPGVVFKNNETTPYVIGETLVHEADHQFFYAVERFHRLWQSDVKQQAPTYFSPWRDDPRPLDAVLKGLSAFARVSGYYATTLASFPFSREDNEPVGTLLLTRLEEADVAFTTISEAGQLSEFGTRYLDDIRDTLDQARTSATNHKQYGKWRDRALDSVETHRENWQRLNMREP